MNYLDGQISSARENYNYFFAKLIFSILQNIFKLSIILLLSIIFNYTIINIAAIVCTIYYFYSIISTSKYYLEIINDIKATLACEELCFEINVNLLNIGLFRSMVKYGK